MLLGFGSLKLEIINKTEVRLVVVNGVQNALWALVIQKCLISYGCSLGITTSIMVLFAPLVSLAVMPTATVWEVSVDGALIRSVSWSELSSTNSSARTFLLNQSLEFFFGIFIN